MGSYTTEFATYCQIIRRVWQRCGAAFTGRRRRMGESGTCTLLRHTFKNINYGVCSIRKHQQAESSNTKIRICSRGHKPLRKVRIG
jgi:hypothetical protein